MELGLETESFLARIMHLRGLVIGDPEPIDSTRG